MILADTSVWIDHLRSPDQELQERLLHRTILMHPLVFGELAMGNLRHRSSTLSLLENLPGAFLAENEEVYSFVERHRIFGRGVGFIDAHLLAATALTPQTRLWTRDRRLHEVALSLGLAIPAGGTLLQ